MESRMSRLKVLGGSMMLALLAWAGGCTATAPRPVAPDASVGAAPAAQSWHLEVGAESPDHAVQMLQFYPAAITVNVGDTITWTNPNAELHTVTFLAPAQEPPLAARNDPQATTAPGHL